MADDLSGDTRKLIADRLAASEQLTGDYEKDAQKGLFQDFKPTQYDFGFNAQNDAISNRAKAKFLDPVLSDLETRQRVEHSGNVQRQLKSSQGLAMGQLRYDNARAMAAQQRVAQEEAQRAAMIGSLFQVGGTIGGALVGGPKGAAIGNVLGAETAKSTVGAQQTGAGNGYANTPGRTA